MSVRVELDKARYREILHGAAPQFSKLRMLIEEVQGLENIGISYSDDDTKAIINNITNLKDFDLNAAMGIVSVGGEVYNYPVYTEITESQYGKEVPEYMPKRTKLVEDKEVSLVWSEYKDATHEHWQNDKNYYIENDGRGDFLKGSEFAQLVQEGYKVYSQPEYVEMKQEASESQEEEGVDIKLEAEVKAK